jgi:hypothetical protein
MLMLAVSVAFLIRAPLSFAQVPTNSLRHCPAMSIHPDTVQRPGTGAVEPMAVRSHNHGQWSIIAFNRYEAFKPTP